MIVLSANVCYFCTEKELQLQVQKVQTSTGENKVYLIVKKNRKMLLLKLKRHIFHKFQSSNFLARVGCLRELT